MGDDEFNYDQPAIFKKRQQKNRGESEEKKGSPKQGHRLDSNAIGKQKISAFKLRKSGHSTIVTIPEQVLNVLELNAGDYLEFVYLEEEKMIVIQPSENGNKKKKS